jgi:hypothetical protein
MKNRICQAVLAMFAGIAANFIFWPGPHGGPQFLRDVLWVPEPDGPPAILRGIVIGLVLLGVAAAFIPGRRLRIGTTWAALIGLMILFILLLLRIYPPVLYIVLFSAIPFLGALAGCAFIAHRFAKAGDG